MDASFDAFLGVTPAGTDLVWNRGARRRPSTIPRDAASRSLTDLVAPTESAPAREVVLARPPTFCESISRSENGGMLPVDAHAGAKGGRMINVTVRRSLREAARAESCFRGVVDSGRGRIG